MIGGKRPRRGMVLAAGLGRRLRPITDTIPKPMVPVAGRALVDHALDRFAEARVETCVVNLHHKAEVLRQHLQGRTTPHLLFSDETDLLLETGGGVRKALPLLGEAPFYVANADVLWLNGAIPAMTRLADIWDDATMDSLLLLHSCISAYGYEGPGDFFLDPVGGIRRRGEHEVAPFLFAGVQILHPRLFAETPDGPFSLNLLFDRAIEAGRLYGIVHDGAWFHVGTPEALAQVDGWLREVNFVTG
ncbi:MAG: nucleotidyltransferase family protein [Alphaproteobacteria bacterium]